MPAYFSIFHLVLGDSVAANFPSLDLVDGSTYKKSEIRGFLELSMLSGSSLPSALYRRRIGRVRKSVRTAPNAFRN